MYCNHCGKVIQDDAAVCAYCGVRIGSCLARRRLMRPRAGRKIAGVCLGFSEYFDIDVTLVRVVWLMVAFMTVIGFLSYPSCRKSRRYCLFRPERPRQRTRNQTSA